MTYSKHGWTYGAEHEWADHDLSTDLPEGYGRDTHDITIVNSNGIANDPRGKLYGFGGEINTPPTDSIQGQVNCLFDLKKLLPEAKVNYRSNLHIHIRVPGLGEDLQALKRVQAHIHKYMPTVLAQIEPIPRPTAEEYPDAEEHKGALRRWRRRRVSHQTLLTPRRLRNQLQAKSVKDFWYREPPHSKTFKPLFHLQPRLCVNLRQHLQTDTVEFRHFPGTMSPSRLLNCLQWCNDYMRYALADKPVDQLLAAPQYATDKFPPFPPYCHFTEKLYRTTVHDGTVSKGDIKRNIEEILRL